jgi:secreted trypsin-like serine protease
MNRIAGRSYRTDFGTPAGRVERSRRPLERPQKLESAERGSDGTRAAIFPVMARWLIALAVAFSSAACAARASAEDDGQAIGQTAQAITNASDDDADPGVVALLLAGQVICTGVLVASRVVVTAAHCVDQGAPDTVYFGADPSTKKGTFIKVADTKAHPDFDDATLASDIGVVALAVPAPTSPLAISRKPFDSSFVGQKVRLVGFGASHGGALAQSKQVGTTTIASYKDQNFRFLGAPSQTCEGDSGGPAFATIDGRETVVGITSAGDTDCKVYGRDTRIDVFASWLADYEPPGTSASVQGRGCGIAPGSGASGLDWLVFLGCAVAAKGRRARRRLRLERKTSTPRRDDDA